MPLTRTIFLPNSAIEVTVTPETDFLGRENSSGSSLPLKYSVAQTCCSRLDITTRNIGWRQ